MCAATPTISKLNKIWSDGTKKKHTHTTATFTRLCKFMRNDRSGESSKLMLTSQCHVSVYCSWWSSSVYHGKKMYDITSTRIWEASMEIPRTEQSCLPLCLPSTRAFVDIFKKVMWRHPPSVHSNQCAKICVYTNLPWISLAVSCFSNVVARQNYCPFLMRDHDEVNWKYLCKFEELFLWSQLSQTCIRKRSGARAGWQQAVFSKKFWISERLKILFAVVLSSAAVELHVFRWNWCCGFNLYEDEKI